MAAIVNESIENNDGSTGQVYVNLSNFFFPNPFAKIQIKLCNNGGKWVRFALQRNNACGNSTTCVCLFMLVNYYPLRLFPNQWAYSSALVQQPVWFFMYFLFHVFSIKQLKDGTVHETFTTWGFLYSNMWLSGQKATTLSMCQCCFQLNNYYLKIIIFFNVVLVFIFK